MLVTRRFRPSVSLLAVALSVLAAAVWTGGCASSIKPISNPEMTREIRARGLDPAAVTVPFAITDEMRAWVHKTVPDNEGMERKLELLLLGLVADDGLKLEYEAGYTGTAREVFETRRANCLAFTSLFVGLAREVGVPVFYLDVEDIEKFEKEGDLVVVSGHVSAGYGLARDLRVLDFAADPQPSGTYRRVHRISDMTAVSLYHSNRGAELLRAGKEKEALVWLREAVALDPEFSRPYINLGVALRRSGDNVGAEKAYRRALELDPDAVSAYQNLASLLRGDDRGSEADGLLALAGKIGSRNPYSYLALGDLSFSQRRYEEARRFYRRALRLYRGNAEPYAAMGLVSYATGDTGDAERWLNKALAIDQENFRVKHLSSRLRGGHSQSNVG
jgi:Flp pilus assembly protein TadD